MPNPLFSNKTSPNGATSPGNSVNDSYKRYKRGYNRFNYGRSFYNTERYADINLIEVMEGVEGDKLKFGNKHEIRSYTLKSPIMFDIFKKKTYFMTDMKAILPNNWDKVYKQPNKGDDVSEDVNCYSHFLLRFYSFIQSIYLNANVQKGYSFDASYYFLTDNELYSKNTYNYLWRMLFLFESIFSDGSLLASMNCHLSGSLKVLDDSGNVSNKTFDEWLQETFSWFTTLDQPGRSLYVKFPSLSDKSFTNQSGDSSRVSVSSTQLFDMLRTYSDWEFEISTTTETQALRHDFILKQFSKLKPRISSFEESTVSLNLSRLVAYQLCCNQFYTNDSVDNVYNAELFMQNTRSIVQPVFNPTSAPYAWPTFIYNGVTTDYDVFSGHVINIISGPLVYYMFGSASNIYKASYDLFLRSYYYFHMIFFYRKSLRYGDYFVGAKTLPYAPVDVTAEVASSGVSAIEITRSILAQRFANAVERVSNTWKDYLSGVMDGVAPPDVKEPRFLASSTSKVGGFEVENTTSDDQGAIVTILKSQNSNYVYEVECGSPCIIIGVSTYEIPRVYSKTVDRFFRHANRFDMFNKFMQNVGDQEISMNERSASFALDDTFGYTPRHMEYKQRYPIASGGFVGNSLPGYAFITDNVDSGQTDDNFSSDALKITSSYIRNRNGEMDRFYSSLTGFTLSSYFHFIVKYNNIVDARRQMEYSPSIL